MWLSSIKLEPIMPGTPVDARPPQVARDRRVESQIHQLRDRHWTMLYIAVFVVGVSYYLQLGGLDAVNLAGTHVQLPSLCGSRTLFGIECPGCGLTRSFITLAGGDLQQSLHFHRLGWLLALAIVAQFPYRTYSLLELRHRVVYRTWPKWFGYFLIAALILNWLLKVSGR